MICSLGISNFLEEISSLSHSIVFLIICIVHLGRLSYLSLLFYGTVHSDGYIFPNPLPFSPMVFREEKNGKLFSANFLELEVSLSFL